MIRMILWNKFVIFINLKHGDNLNKISCVVLIIYFMYSGVSV